MEIKRARIIQWTALLGCGFIATQIATILLRGEAFCLNEGCKIIENLTTIPPLYINLAGFLYFLAVFVAGCWSQDRPQPHFDWLRLLLLVGLAVEGVLGSYQLFVVQTICSYCMIVLGLVLLLNIICGHRQLMIGLPIFLAVLITSSFLNFGSSQIMIQAQNFNQGTFAVKGADITKGQLYLFFSSDCPHCRNVLTAIEEAKNCEINFNPIDRIDSLDVSGLNYSSDYNPSLNRLLLSLLDIKTIPVLLSKTVTGLTFIKGEAAIVEYLKNTCVEPEIDPLGGMSSDESPLIGTSPVETAPEGECEIEEACPDDNLQQQSSPGEY